MQLQTSVSVTIDDVRSAAGRIAPIIHITPVLTSRSFNAAAGVEAFFKCENFQRGGAFKLRGAANFVYSLPPGQRAAGLVGYSSGNHAQAVAIAAAHAGVAATLVMPSDAPRSKREATRGYGAAIVEYDRLSEDREAIGRRIAEKTGAAIAPPFDHPWIISGQGTCALELLERIPDLDALVAPIGGGGLLAGCSVAAKALRPQIRIFGVEPEGANDTFLSFRSGERVEIPPPDTVADGLRSTKPGAITFPILQRNIEDIVLVSEREILETMRWLLARMKILAEPSGAVSAAAVLHGRLPKGLGRVGVILSGGNADLEILAQ